MNFDTFWKCVFLCVVCYQVVAGAPPKKGKGPTQTMPDDSMLSNPDLGNVELPVSLSRQQGRRQELSGKSGSGGQTGGRPYEGPYGPYDYDSMRSPRGREPYPRMTDADGARYEQEHAEWHRDMADYAHDRAMEAIGIVVDSVGQFGRAFGGGRYYDDNNRRGGGRRWLVL